VVAWAGELVAPSAELVAVSAVVSAGSVVDWVDYPAITNLLRSPAFGDIISAQCADPRFFLDFSQ
jgi:hypothetical protein